METEDYDNFGHDWHHKYMFRGFYGQAKRGDMTPIILNTLAEKPMHGYEIIRELEKKSHGFWRPSPGSVYPTLQLLEEQDLVTSNEVSGKKIYELTDLGRSEASKVKTDGWPWHSDHQDFGAKLELRSTFMELAGTFRSIVKAGDKDKRAEALSVIKDATIKLRSLQESEKEA